MTDKHPSPTRQSASFRDKLHTVIFGAETPAGKWFDLILLLAILLSVVGFCLQTVKSIDSRYGNWLHSAEWFFTILFTIEYGLRLYCVQKPLRYATSFWGIIDLLSFLPTYLGLLLTNTPSFVVIRAFRLLRVFRILKLGWFMSEADELGKAILNARAKIVVFIAVIMISVTVAGTLMYEVENLSYVMSDAVRKDPDQISLIAELQQQLAAADMTVRDLTPRNPNQILLIIDVQEQLNAADLTANDLLQTSKFTNIPESMYWATVTMTTVGYGDIVPTTVGGKIIATMLIMLGYSLIIVPTGFVSAEFMKAKSRVSNRACPHCLTEDHNIHARFCQDCGGRLSLNDRQK